MQKNDFTHLHVHTEYSVLDGINRVSTLPKYIKDLGHEAVAITDHGNISGSYKFFKECNKAEVQPIIGMEAYYTVNDRTVKEKDEFGQAYYHLVLLAQNNTGLKNLRMLTSKSYIEGRYFKPRIDDALLAEYNEGIMATSACLGSRSSQLILNNETKAAELLLDHHAAIFKDRFFIEVQLHADKDQQTINKELLHIAKKKNWPVVLTGDCHYTHEEDKLVHERALCIQTNDVMSNEKRFSFGDIDVHVANTEFLWKHAQLQGMPYDVIKNTSHVASMIDSQDYFSDIRNQFPTFKEVPEGLNADEALERLSKNMLSQKFGGIPPEKYRTRLAEELNIIKKMGFSNYMLIQWRIIQAALELDVSVGPGRGSAGGSLIAYALDITRLDPIKHNLIFSRFLNYGRSGIPLIFPKSIIDQHNDIQTKKETCEYSNPTATIKQNEQHQHSNASSCGHTNSGACRGKHTEPSGFDRYRNKEI